MSTKKKTKKKTNKKESRKSGKKMKPKVKPISQNYKDEKHKKKSPKKSQKKSSKRLNQGKTGLFKLRGNTDKSNNLTEYTFKMYGQKCTKVDYEKYQYYLLPLKRDEFTIYSSDTCSFCHKALDLLNKSRHSHDNTIIEYVNYDINQVQYATSIIPKLNKLTGGYGFIPIVFYKGQFLGGYAELKTFIDQSREYI